MARYESGIGGAEECRNFAQGTDKDYEGIWYHATNEANARAFSSGQKRFESSSGKLRTKISFTKDPNGAARNLANYEQDRWVIQVVIRANRSLGDQVDLDQNGLSNGYIWAHVWDVRNIMVLRGSASERQNGETDNAHTESQEANTLPLKPSIQRI